MAIKRYNATIRNLTYRLRAFKEALPFLLGDIVKAKEDVIVAAIANEQLFRRGITGKGVKIMDFAPYKPSTIKAKKRKGQPTTRVTLRDTRAFHNAMYVVFDEEGFYITSSDTKTAALKAKYGDDIFRLTDENFNRVLRSHIRRELVKRLKTVIQK